VTPANLSANLQELFRRSRNGIVLVRFPDLNEWDGSTSGQWMAAASSYRENYMCGSERFLDVQFDKSALSDTPEGAVVGLLQKLDAPPAVEEEEGGLMSSATADKGAAMAVVLQRAGTAEIEPCDSGSHTNGPLQQSGPHPKGSA
jgi:hypothetical protein